jgi:flagellar basal body-associated protein FliL
MAVVLLLILVLIGGTLYALVSRGPAVFFKAPEAATAASPGREDAAVFTGIGRIRALTAGPQAATVILSVTFPYVPEDRFFSEELDARIGRFRGITADYFASFSAEELRKKEDGVLKEELRQRYNAALSLGTIPRLYINEYLIIE